MTPEAIVRIEIHNVGAWRAWVWVPKSNNPIEVAVAPTLEAMLRRLPQAIRETRG